MPQGQPSFPDFSVPSPSDSLEGKKLAGVDEVGRGPIAGPVVAAAALFPPDYLPRSTSSLHQLTDSKRLTARNREKVAEELHASPDVNLGIACISAEEIDELNIWKATKKAMGMALEALATTPDLALIDGRPVDGLSVPSQAIVKGDLKRPEISAASIIAKVYRDDVMVHYSKKFPSYGFASNKGYATQAHLDALRKFGVCELHRKTFAPVRSVHENGPSQPDIPALDV